ncbi:MAG: cobalamin biosynthesis protein CobD [Deltaproteobacteria bacterium]|nr:cobalamin biosynthesis protein CobD [Deltaproteobacteria bacterium]
MDSVIPIFAGAMLLDELVGDPQYRWHPVRLMGTAFQWLEFGFFKLKFTGRLAGVLFVTMCLAAVFAVWWPLRFGMYYLWLPMGMAFDVFVLYSMVAQKDLLAHVRSVLHPVEQNDLVLAREKLSMIVSRKTENLPLDGIVRSAVESVAENFVDGSMAVICFAVAGALLAVVTGGTPATGMMIGPVAYRVVNTLDAMVGYKNERYLRFGWASARFDDVLNFIPARLSIVPLLFGTLLMRGHVALALRSFFLDRNKTPSINSGHPESVLAGAIGICVGGPVAYAQKVTNGVWIGCGTRDAAPQHLRRAIGIVYTAGIFNVISALLVLMAVYSGRQLI